MIENSKNKAQSISFLLISFVLLLLLSDAFAAEKKTIGIIMTGNIPYYSKMHQVFVEKLSRDGYRDVEILLQKPHPDLISWSNAARKLIALEVDIIVTYGASATLAAVNERTKIPIVYAGVNNPEAIGITGKNVTGSKSKVPVSSLLRYLKTITTISKLGVLYSESEKDCINQLDELINIAKEFDFKIVRLDIKRIDDVKKIKTAGRLDALLLTGSSSVNMYLEPIMEIAKANKLPTASLLRDENNSGIIITLSASPEEQGEITAEKVVKILQGAHPSTISPSNGKNIELIFNLKENMALGYKIPMGLVTEATKIIQ